MNREIKFRAWDTRNNKMRSSRDYYLKPQSITGEHPACLYWQPEIVYPEDLILMQYTGLKDKNGKEIYEGDIIQHQNEEADKTPYAVPEMTLIGMETIIGIGDSEWDEGNNKYSNIEVIGNIYENPEFLTNK